MITQRAALVKCCPETLCVFNEIRRYGSPQIGGFTDFTVSGGLRGRSQEIAAQRKRFRKLRQKFLSHDYKNMKPAQVRRF